MPASSGAGAPNTPGGGGRRDPAAVERDVVAAHPELGEFEEALFSPGEFVDLDDVVSWSDADPGGRVAVALRRQVALATSADTVARLPRGAVLAGLTGHVDGGDAVVGGLRASWGAGVAPLVGPGAPDGGGGAPDGPDAGAVAVLERDDCLAPVGGPFFGRGREVMLVAAAVVALPSGGDGTARW